MASRVCRNRALASALQPARPSPAAHNGAAARYLSATAPQHVVVPKDAPNTRGLPRDPPSGGLKAPVVNPADKYASKGDAMHRYGTWVMGCLPKYVQQFSVWKDELTIHISPSGVIPVFSFLKCKLQPQNPLSSPPQAAVPLPLHPAMISGDTGPKANPPQTTPPPSSPKSAPSQPPTIPLAPSASR